MIHTNLTINATGSIAGLKPTATGNLKGSSKIVEIEMKKPIFEVKIEYVVPDDANFLTMDGNYIITSLSKVLNVQV